jgi:hypothetical protein
LEGRVDKITHRVYYVLGCCEEILSRYRVKLLEPGSDGRIVLEPIVKRRLRRVEGRLLFS